MATGTRHHRPTSPAPPDLETKVAFLRRPETYAKAGSPAGGMVETVETHMAWVFLTDCHAWKLKKPVRYAFLDFSTLEAREEDSRQEVQLNRRLAPDVYLGAVPLLRDDEGGLRPGDEEKDRSGTVVDWLVKMRRLPAHRMLDVVIAEDRVREEEVRAVGRLLAGFHALATPVAMPPDEFRSRLETSIGDNARELARLATGLSIARVETVKNAQLEFVRRQADLLEQRVRDGRIVDGHGDLRPEHVCLEAPPVIIDCIEFNGDFRVQDAACDLAFLTLECARLGAKQVADWLGDSYYEHRGDDCPLALRQFYRSYHALTRSKIALWHLEEATPPEAGRWTAKANEYLAMAAALGENLPNRDF